MKVKLQRHFAYKYKDKKHYKHVIVVPEEAISQLVWKAGQELNIEIQAKEGQLIIGLNQAPKIM